MLFDYSVIYLLIMWIDLQFLFTFATFAFIVVVLCVVADFF